MQSGSDGIEIRYGRAYNPDWTHDDDDDANERSE
jgi:hypothetical protein